MGGLHSTTPRCQNDSASSMEMLPKRQKTTVFCVQKKTVIRSRFGTIYAACVSYIVSMAASS